MTPPPSLESLTAALRAAGAAHHEFEQHYLRGVRDGAWPGWYAAYVLGRAGDFTAPTALARWLWETPAEGDWASDAAHHVLTRLQSPLESP